MLAQNEVFQFLSKINIYNFSDFLHEVTLAQRLKLEPKDFLGKI